MARSRGEEAAADDGQVELPHVVKQVVSAYGEKASKGASEEERAEELERLDEMLRSEVLERAEAACTGRAVGESTTGRDASTMSHALPVRRAASAEAQYYIAMAAMISLDTPEAFMLPRTFEHLSSWLKGTTLFTKGEKVRSVVVSLLPTLAAVVLERAINAKSSGVDADWPLELAIAAVEDIFGSRIWVDNAQCCTFVSKLLTALTGADLEDGGDAHIGDTRAQTAANERARANVSSTASAQEQQQQQQQQQEQQRLQTAKVKGAVAAVSGADRNIGSVAGGAPPQYMVSSRAVYRNADTVAKVRTLFMSQLRNLLAGKRPSDFTHNTFRLLTLATYFSEGRAMVSTFIESFLNTSNLSRLWRPLLDQLTLRLKTDDAHDLQAVANVIAMKIRGTNASLHNELVVHVASTRKEYGGIAIRLFAADISPQNPMNLKSLSAVLTAMRGSDDMYAEKVLAAHLISLASSEEKRTHIRSFVRQLSKAPKALENLSVASICEHVLGQQDIDVQSMTKDSKIAFLTQVIDIVTMLEVVIVQHDAEKKSAAGEVSATLAHGLSGLLAKHMEWCQSVLATALPSIPQSNFVSVIRRLLFLEREEKYFASNESVGETEKAAIRALRKVRVQEEVIIRVVLMGLSPDVPLAQDAALRILEDVIMKEGMDRADGDCVSIESVEIVEAILKLSAFRPHDIQDDDENTVFAIESVYWRSWLVVAIMAIWSNDSLRAEMWSTRPRCVQLWEMLATGSAAFPPTPASEDDAADIRARSALRIAESSALVERMRENVGDASMPTSTVVIWDAYEDAAPLPLDVIRRLEDFNAHLGLGRRLRSMTSPQVFSSITSRQSLDMAWTHWLRLLTLNQVDSLECIPVSWCWQILFALDTPGQQMHKEHVHILRKVLRKVLDAYISSETLVGASSSLDETHNHRLFVNFIRQIASPSVAIRMRVLHCLGGIFQMPDARSKDSPAVERAPRVDMSSITYAWIDELRTRNAPTSSELCQVVAQTFGEALAYTRSVDLLARSFGFIDARGRHFPSRDSAAWHAIRFASERPLHTEHLLMDARGDFRGAVAQNFLSLIFTAIQGATANAMRSWVVQTVTALLYRLQCARAERVGTVRARTESGQPADAVPTDLSPGADTHVHKLLENIREAVYVVHKTSDPPPSIPASTNHKIAHRSNLVVDRASLFSGESGAASTRNDSTSSRAVSIWRQLALFAPRQMFDKMSVRDKQHFVETLARARTNDRTAIPEHIFRLVATNHSLGAELARALDFKKGEHRDTVTLPKKVQRARTGAVHDGSGDGDGRAQKRAKKHQAHDLSRRDTGLELCNTRIQMACAATSMTPDSLAKMYAPGKSLEEVIAECRIDSKDTYAAKEHRVHVLHSLRRADLFRPQSSHGEVVTMNATAPRGDSSGHRHMLEQELCAHLLGGDDTRTALGARRTARPGSTSHIEDATHRLMKLATESDMKWTRSTASAIALCVDALVLVDPELRGQRSQELVCLAHQVAAKRTHGGRTGRHAMRILRLILVHVRNVSEWRTKKWMLDHVLTCEATAGYLSSLSSELASTTLDFVECVLSQSLYDEGTSRNAKPIDARYASPVLALVVVELRDSGHVVSKPPMARLKACLSLFDPDALVCALSRLEDVCKDAGLMAQCTTLVERLSACGVGHGSSNVAHDGGGGTADASSRAGGCISECVVFGLKDLRLADAVRIVAGARDSSDTNGAGSSLYAGTAAELARALNLCYSAAREEPSTLLRHLDAAVVVFKALVSAASSGCEKSAGGFARGVRNVASIFEHLAVNAKASCASSLSSIELVITTVLAGFIQIQPSLPLSPVFKKALDKFAMSAHDLMMRDSRALSDDVVALVRDAVDAFPEEDSLPALLRTITASKDTQSVSECDMDKLVDNDGADRRPHKARNEMAYIEALSYLDVREVFSSSTFDAHVLENALTLVEQVCSRIRFPEQLFTLRVSSLLIRIALRPAAAAEAPPSSVKASKLRPLAWRLLRDMLNQPARPSSLCTILASNGNSSNDDDVDEDEEETTTCDDDGHDALRRRIALTVGDGLASALERGRDTSVSRAALDICPTVFPMLPASCARADVIRGMMRLGATRELTLIAMA